MPGWVGVGNAYFAKPRGAQRQNPDLAALAWPRLRHALGALLIAAHPFDGFGRVHIPADYHFRAFSSIGMFGLSDITLVPTFCGAFMGGRGLLKSTDRAPYATSFCKG